MNRYYKGKHAHHYNTRWLRFNTKTLNEALAMIDITTLRNIHKQQGRLPRVLDVGCGTGLLLKRLLVQVPDMQVFGLDASADMLAEARVALAKQPNVHLQRMRIAESVALNPPYTKEYFDLITCTNALHDIPEAVALLAELEKVLTPGGQLVVEDFAPRQPRLLWATFEWFLQLIEGNRVHAYRLKEAKLLCEQAGLSVVREKAFTIDWLWHGWIVSAYRTASDYMSSCFL